MFLLGVDFYYLRQLLLICLQKFNGRSGGLTGLAWPSAPRMVFGHYGRHVVNGSYRNLPNALIFPLSLHRLYRLRAGRIPFDRLSGNVPPCRLLVGFWL